MSELLSSMLRSDSGMVLAVRPANRIAL